MPNLVTSHTVAGWFSIANVNSGSFYLFSDNYNGVGSGLEIRGAGGDFKFWITGKDTQDLVINSSLPLQNDQLYFVAAIYDSINLNRRIYFNGSIVAELTDDTGTISEDSGGFNVGFDSMLGFSNVSQTGQIDELMVFT